MRAADYLRYFDIVLYTAVAIVALGQWRRHRERAALWAALTFGTLALVVDAGEVLPEDLTGTAEYAATRLLIAALVLFPYLLYKFAAEFRPTGRRLELLVAGLTALMLVWTFALPSTPEEGEPWPSWYLAYIVGFAAHWTLLSVVVAVRMWAAARNEASVARHRMRLLAFGSSAITVALLVAIATSRTEDSGAAELVTQLLSALSAASFLIGLSPPPWLRYIWRRREQERLQHAVAGLMRAETGDEVVERVLPPMADIVGARAVELRDAEGTLVGAHGEPAEAQGRVTKLDVAGGELTIWTSPYAPYFGGEELGLLRALGGLTAVALDRARLFSQERDARVALQRADELKTNFIALAAHELRTPVTTIHGLTETLYSRRHALDPDVVDEVEGTLREQTLRMKNLVEQVLDLSRLDAEAVEINPQPLAVRARVESVVGTAAGPRADEVQVEVDPSLVATVDPNAFDRILTNLVVNALRYGTAPVTVSAHQNDRHFRVTVEDRGHGVDPEFVPNLFERFSRSKSSRQSIGTGLGLAIARSYAQAHRGDLIYEAAKPRGARFLLVLPLWR